MYLGDGVWFGFLLQAEGGAGLVDKVDRFVGKIAVCYVPV
jgi:hypothetical protein